MPLTLASAAATDAAGTAAANNTDCHTCKCSIEAIEVPATSIEYLLFSAAAVAAAAADDGRDAFARKLAATRDEMLITFSLFRSNIFMPRSPTKAATKSMA